MGSKMQIINAHEVKCLDRSSVRLKCAMPTRENNAHGIRSVFWMCIPTLNYWNGTISSFGVVSNRTRTLVNAYEGLKDAYGVTVNPSGYVYKGNPENKTSSAHIMDESAGALMVSFANGSKTGIEYVVSESKLNFYRNDETEPKYTMDLPTDVAD